MTLNVQFYTMIAMVIGGIYLGIALETFRRLSITWKHRQIPNYGLEVLFWLIQTFILFYVLYRVNAGELRIYIILACLLGFSMYQALIAPIYKRLLEYMISLFKNIYQLCRQMIHILIITPIRWLIIVIGSVLSGLLTMLLFIVKVIITPIRWLFNVLFALLPKSLREKLHKLPAFYTIIKDRGLKWIKRILKRR